MQTGTHILTRLTTWYVGLMSGTSLDGVDAVLATSASAGDGVKVVAHAYRPFSESIQQDILALNSPGSNELHRAALLANSVSFEYAQVVAHLLDLAGVASVDVCALGAHGQTVRHRPGEFDGVGYTLQLLNGALLAELAGIDVICDFRTRDVAAGGQGAPLVPAFHSAMFGVPGRDLAVLNLGGIANLTLLGQAGDIRGFDCGPGNALMDHWIAKHQGLRYDAGGRWAAQGKVLPMLLAQMLSEPFLYKAPPKSTGRDLFNPDWLTRQVLATALDSATPPADVQATLLEFTARSAANALQAHLPQATTLLVCGGGALNLHLMNRLAALKPSLQVQSTDVVGLPAQQVEAAAFAWLARCFVERRAASASEVTGARGPRVLGALYPTTQKPICQPR